MIMPSKIEVAALLAKIGVTMDTVTGDYSFLKLK